jgi:hypothetical protein
MSLKASAYHTEKEGRGAIRRQLALDRVAVLEVVFEPIKFSNHLSSKVTKNQERCIWQAPQESSAASQARVLHNATAPSDIINNCPKTPLSDTYPPPGNI